MEALFGKIAVKERANVFTLGDRIKILLSNDTIIIPQVAELENTVLKSKNALIDRKSRSRIYLNQSFFY